MTILILCNDRPRLTNTEPVRGKILKLALTFFLCWSLVKGKRETNMEFNISWASSPLRSRPLYPNQTRVIDLMVLNQSASLLLASQPLTCVWMYLQYESQATCNTMHSHITLQRTKNTLPEFPLTLSKRFNDMLQASFKLLAAAWDLQCHVTQQSISPSHTPWEKSLLSGNIRSSRYT